MHLCTSYWIIKRLVFICIYNSCVLFQAVVEFFAGKASRTVVGQRGVDRDDCLVTFGCLTLILVRPPIQCVSIGWEPVPLLLDAILRKPPTKMLFPPRQGLSW